MSLSIIVFAAAAALGRDPPPPADMYRNGTAIATMGAVLTPLAVVAYNVPSAGMRGAGFVGGLVAPPMLAGGSARAARGVTDMGVRVAPVGSVVCGIGWFGANLLSLAAPESLAPVALFGGAYVAGIGQLVANGVGYGRAGRSRRAPPPRRTTVDVSGSIDPKRPGVVISGTF